MRRMGMLSECSSNTLVSGIDANEDRYYCLSILDKHHHPDISFEQCMKILRMCTDELQRRMPIDFKGMTVKLVKKDGIQDLEYDMSKPVIAASSSRLYEHAWTNG